MTKNYIALHFGEILNHGCDIEKRMDDSDCTLERLTDDNERFITGFKEAGEQVVLIDNDYEKAIWNLLLIFNLTE